MICEPGTGYITTKRVLHFKRWWQKVPDVGTFTLEKFRKQLSDHFGSLSLAWRKMYDPDEDGSCCFWVFCRENHKLGIKRRLRSLWAELTDGEPLRCIHLADLDPEGDRLIAHFVLCLAVKYGGLRSGWSAMINQDDDTAFHKSDFVDFCKTFDIEAKSARWLFNVLDKDNTRYLTVFDAPSLNFLALYDPGDVSGMSMEDLKHSHAQTRKLVEQSKQKGTGIFAADSTNPADIGLDEQFFDFVIELTQAEHEEYLRRCLNRRLIAGEHAHIEERKTKGVRQLQLEARLKDLTDTDWFLNDDKSGKLKRSASTPSTGTGTPSRFTPLSSRPSTPGSRGAFSGRRYA